MRTKQLKNYLTSKTNRLVRSLWENSPDTVILSKIRNMLILDETASLAAESLSLIISGLISDEYNHEDERIKKSVNEMMASSSIVNNDFWQKCSQFMTFGFTFADLVYKVVNRVAIIQSIDFLEQEYVLFDDEDDKKVTYQTIELINKPGFTFHLVNQTNLISGRNPYGFRLADRALNYWELHKIAMASYAVVAQKQATKLLVGKTDTSARIVTGQTPLGTDIEVANSVMMLEALEAADNSGVLVVDIEDEVEAVDQASDGKFFMDLFYFTDTKRFRAYYHPATMYAQSQSGVGDSNIANVQQDNLTELATVKAQYITTQFVEQVLKPAIIYTFGEQKNYGSFPINRRNPKFLEISDVYVKYMNTLAKLLTVENVTAESKAELIAMMLQFKALLGITT